MNSLTEHVKSRVVVFWVSVTRYTIFVFIINLRSNMHIFFLCAHWVISLAELYTMVPSEGHRAPLIFPLAAFCQIIRKLYMIFCLHSHCSHVIDMLIKFHQNHISQALLKCMHVHCLSILTKFCTFFCIR